MAELLFGFEGRIGRGRFWAGQFCVLALGWLYVDHVERLLVQWLPGSIYLGFAVALILALPVFWIQAAITVKRCHDRGKSGFWALLLLVPAIGPIWLVVDCGLLRGVAPSSIEAWRVRA